MVIFRSATPLAWGSLDVPLLGLVDDWWGEPVSPPAAYALGVDDQRLWFLAHHPRPARLHPQARAGDFRSELWKYDVAELFLRHPESGRYLECNLAPNGAWWTCAFQSPRVRCGAADEAMPGVAAFADVAPDGGWLAALSLPLDGLEAAIGFGPATHANVTMILESPHPRFLTAHQPTPGEPDFHHPSLCSPVTFTPLDAVLSGMPAR